jgi:hypothetical protein
MQTCAPSIPSLLYRHRVTSIAPTAKDLSENTEIFCIVNHLKGLCKLQWTPKTATRRGIP